jgi:hypothetical protein
MSAQPQKTSEVSRSHDGVPESVKSVFSKHPAALEAVTDWFDEKKVGHNREVTWETKGKRGGITSVSTTFKWYEGTTAENRVDVSEDGRLSNEKEVLTRPKTADD